jgi:tripartite-type tricarboxylate transporter receptor subunit TctC
MNKRLVAAILFSVLAFSPVFAAGGKEGGGTAGAAAVSWPEGKLITIVVPVTVGGNMDVKARIFAKYLPKYVEGVNVVVENRPGASGITALTEYLLEKPDTSKILYLSLGHSIITPFFSETRYTKDDFVPLYVTDSVENGLFVNPAKTGVKTVADLIAYGKGKIVKFGANSNNDTFLMTKVLLTLAGLKSDVVSANSAPEHLVNCLAGTVDVAYAALNLGRDYVEEGKLWPLGAFTVEPYTGYKGMTVPTFTEQGYDAAYTAYTYFGIRKGTSDAVVKYLEDVFAKIGNDPDFKKEFAAAGFVQLEDPSAASLKQRMDKLDEDMVRFEGLIK